MGAETRYADALFSTVPADDTMKVSDLLSDFCDRIADTQELRLFLQNPSIPVPVRKETAGMLLPEGTPEVVGHFIALLIDRNRLHDLPGICEAFKRIADQARHCLVIHVTSARLLDEIQLTHIKEKYGSRHNAQSVQIQQDVDPSLLGGIRVQVGDMVIEDTLRARLTGLRAALNDYVS